MSLDVSTVRDGIKAQLATITGLRAHDVMPATVNPPCAVVWLRPPVDYDETMGRGVDKFGFDVFVVVGKVSERIAQDKLDLYVSGSGASSIKTAVESAINGHEKRSLNGSVGAGAARVSRLVDYGPATIGGTDYLAAHFELEVHG